MTSATPLAEFRCRTRLLFGKDSRFEIGHELRTMGASRPLVVTDRGVEESGVVDLCLTALRTSNTEPAGIYASVRQDAPIGCVDEAAAVGREHQADSVIAIGGGSVLDAAKAVCILLSEGEVSFRTYLTDSMGFAPQPTPLLPHIGVPTTAGTGAEVTWGAIYLDEENHQKCGYLHLYMSPDVAVLDPEFTVGLPPFITATTAFDAITHGIEGSTCLTATPLGDAVALQGIELLCGNLARVMEEPTNRGARLNMQIGASLTALAAVNYIGGVVHALSHTVGAVAGVPHGLGNALALPLGLRFNGPVYDFEKIVAIARAVGIKGSLPDSAESVANVVADAIEGLRASCGLPSNLRDAGYAVDGEKLEALATQALTDPETFGNPRPISGEDFVSLFRTLLGH
ncbi:MAG: iron-containing alcohol dehydrogenase [Actinomycetota bacterium]